MATINTGPAAVNTGATTTILGPLDSAPAPVSSAVDPQVPPPTPVFNRPVDRAPDPVAPSPGLGISSATATVASIPVTELPVDTANQTSSDGGTQTGTPIYIKVLSDGTVVTSPTTVLNFLGAGVSVTANGTQANITIIGSDYGNSNVVALLGAFGSNTISTAGNITGGNMLANGSMSITGNLTVNGNATLSGNILGDRVQNGTTSFDIQTQNGNANITVAGTSNVVVFATTGVLVTGLITASGNITGGNVLTGGLISATGNITGGNILGGANVNATTHTGTTVSVSANVTGGNILTAGLISATGNVTSGNVLTGGAVSATGNIAGNYFIGNGSQLTGLPAIYGNANVTALLSNLGSNVISGTGNITTTANISGAYVKGNGSELTNLPAPTVTPDISSTGDMSIMTYDGVIKSVNYATVEPSSGNIKGGNITTTGLVSATGNITGNYFIGNGSQLTGLNATTSNISNGTSNVDIPVANGNVIINTAGTYAWTFDDTGNLTLPNNIISNTTIDIDNRASGNGADIRLFAADDITIQARDRSAGSTTEGGDINIFSGDSAEDSDTSAGDIVIEAGRGGASNIDFGGSGGFVRVEAGDGGDAIGANFSARPGGSLTLNAGHAGSNNGNIDLGAAGANVYIGAGDSTGNGVNGGTIYLTSGAADASALAGDVVIQAGGTWTFDNAGNLTVPGNIIMTTGIVGSGASPAPYLSGFSSVSAITISASGNITGGNILTGGLVSATGNVTGNYILGNGSQLTSINAVTVDITDTNGLTTVYYPTFVENRTTAQIARADVDLTYRTDDNLLTVGNVSVTGNITGGNILTSGLISATGNVQAGNIRTAGQVSATGNIVTAGNFVGNGAGLTNVTVSVAGNIVGTQSNVTLVAGSYNWAFDNTGNLTLPGNTFAVNYANSTPVDVVTRFESTWTVATGNSTQSFTVAPSNSYQMWVDCNIANGIVAWNATATITNTNVPVVGAQYAWVYSGGGTPINLTSIPAQFTGTSNTIVSSNGIGLGNTNVFVFGFDNTSGAAQTVRYGWIQIS